MDDDAWWSSDKLSAIQRRIVVCVRAYANSRSIGDFYAIQILVSRVKLDCMEDGCIPVDCLQLFSIQWATNGPHPAYINAVTTQNQDVEERIRRWYGDICERARIFYTYHILIAPNDRAQLGLKLIAIQNDVVRRIYMSLPTWLVYDLLVYEKSEKFQHIDPVKRNLVGTRTDELRAVAQARAFGWDWAGRHHFHPVVRRQVVAFLLAANTAAREGNPLGRLPYELLVKIVNYLVREDAVDVV
jgi:hypothetical protein